MKINLPIITIQGLLNNTQPKQGNTNIKEPIETIVRMYAYKTSASEVEAGESAHWKQVDYISRHCLSNKTK